MNTRVKKTFLFLLLAAMGGLGCELIVDFDRTKIPVDDAGAVDAAPADATNDVVEDAPVDAPVDAPAEAASDAGGGDADADADQ